MAESDLSASLILRRGALARVGLERIALVEAVGELGSISAAARKLGLSYKGAWDAVQALNNLFDAPLIVASPGGKAGGAASVTARGRTVVRAFRDVEREIGAALARLEADLSGPADDDIGGLFWTLGLRTSARNALRGRVARLADGEVTSEVVLALDEGVEVMSIITRRSREELGLVVGAPAVALIKSSFVTLADAADNASADAVNRMAGVVADREDGERVCEVSVVLSPGKTLVATTPRTGAPSIGDRVIALVAPADVILAVE
ncbi:MAG: TOBE domain-containing protein [Caulobacter sp.]|nr:TOBE domain-containing protein [Caulobacter sp.]